MNRQSRSIFRCAVALVVAGSSFGLMQLALAQTAEDSAVVVTQAPPLGEGLKPVPLVIGAGDLLDVQVFGTPDMSGRVRVDQYGNLPLAVGGTVSVAGKTAAEVGKALEDHLKSTHMMREPHVSVFITESATQMVTVMGEVKKPGSIPLYGSQSLYTVLSAVGGTTDLAGDAITISHRNDPLQPLVIHVHTANFTEVENRTQVLPGDTIVVSRAALVYTIGAISRQGATPITNGMPMSLMNLLAISGGITPLAKASKAAIVRQTPTGVVTINVDLKRVFDRKDPDIPMMAADILVVPTSGFKVLTQGILANTVSSAASGAVAIALYR
jgi:polysaccharide export outer membrane protein